jgi:hypothetical protein
MAEAATTSEAPRGLLHPSDFEEGYDPQRLQWIEEDLDKRGEVESRFDYLAVCAVTLIQHLDPERIGELFDRYVPETNLQARLEAHYVGKALHIYEYDPELARETARPFVERLAGRYSA